MARPIFTPVYGRPLQKFDGDAVDHEALERLQDQHPRLVHRARDGIWWFGERLGGFEIDPAAPVILAGNVNLAPSPEQRLRVAEFCATLPDWLAADEDLLDLDVYLVRRYS